MAVDSYLYISGSQSPSTTTQGGIDTLSSSQTAPQPATVQLGETSMGALAGRLGIDPNLLLQANPHIKNPDDLKAGQEINLPGNPAIPNQSGGEEPNAGVHHHPHHHHSEESPSAPLGSSLEAGMMKAKLDGLGGKQGDD